MAKPYISILGGDLRQCYAGEYLSSQGWNVTCYGTPDFPYNAAISIADSLITELQYADMVLVPTPLTKDGKNLFQSSSYKDILPLNSVFDALLPGQTLAGFLLPDDLKQSLYEKNCLFLNLGDSPAFMNENAALTAEGLLSELIRYTPSALSQARVLLLGYGRCGSAIGNILLPLCRDIHVIEQDELKCQQAMDTGIHPVTLKELDPLLSHCNIVINTIPSQVLSAVHFSALPGNCHIFDIASKPFGFPANFIADYLIPCHCLPGLPGRFCPETAGQLIGRTIERMSNHAL